MLVGTITRGSARQLDGLEDRYMLDDLPDIVEWWYFDFHSFLLAYLILGRFSEAWLTVGLGNGADCRLLSTLARSAASWRISGVVLFGVIIVGGSRGLEHKADANQRSARGSVEIQLGGLPLV